MKYLALKIYDVDLLRSVVIIFSRAYVPYFDSRMAYVLYVVPMTEEKSISSKICRCDSFLCVTFTCGIIYSRFN